MKGPMQIYYDEEGDFLEVGIGKPSKAYAEEVKPGIFVRRDIKTNEIKSIGVLSFKKRAKKPQDITVSLPVNLEISSIYGNEQKPKNLL